MAVGLGIVAAVLSINGFMGAMTVAMLPTPWLLDRVGFRRCFLWAIIALAAASIAGGLATSFAFVVAARIVQGAAAGLLQPLGTLAVMRLFPVDSQGRASGVLGFSIVLTPAVAPALGGVLLDHFGWQAIFLINLPLCLVAALAGIYLLPQSREILYRTFDWVGVGLLALLAMSLVEGMASLQHSGPAALWTWLQFATASAAGLALFGLSFLLFALFGGHLIYGELVFVTVIGGIGLGLILPALSLAALRHMEMHQLGQSSMVTSYLRQLGGALGIAMAAVFVEWRQASNGAGGIIGAYQDGFLLLALVFGLALAAASRMRAKSSR